MKLLILCAVFSVLLTVSIAGPVKTHIHDVADDSSSNSNESVENKNIEKNLSTQEEVVEEEEKLVGNRIVKIKKEEETDNSSSISSEEDIKNENLVKDPNSDDSSSEEDNAKTNQKSIKNVVFDEDGILDLQNLAHKSKRSLLVIYNSHMNNNLPVRDEGSIKYEKYLKLKRLKREFESNESNDSNDLIRRFVRNAETSEESSSEEDTKKQAPAVSAAKPDIAPAEQIESSAKPEGEAEAVKSETARRRRNADSSEEKSSEEDKNGIVAKPAEGVVIADKPDTAPAEAANSEATRRRRNAESSEEISSEEYKVPSKHSKYSVNFNSSPEEDNQVGFNPDMNEVFVFSNENQQDSEENFKTKTLKINHYVVLSENNKDKSLEKEKSSIEDYAQGCGNNNDDSNENSNEDNETNFNE